MVVSLKMSLKNPEPDAKYMDLLYKLYKQQAEIGKIPRKFH